MQRQSAPGPLVPADTAWWRVNRVDRMFTPKQWASGTSASRPMDDSPRAIPLTFGGRYTIERELGRGGTSTVYLARDDRESKAVAIKVLKPVLAESVTARHFLKEINRTAGLEHPNILPVLDSGSDDGLLYYVLPYMSSGTLRQRLEREKQLPLDDVLSIARDVGAALDHAHARGLIHRDVKPENILFEDGRAFLSDFGIARALERAIDDSSTATGLARGTPAYMSPEQASGARNYDGRTDVYSLGCVLYEAIAGVPAFIGASAEAVIAQRFVHSPRDLLVYRPGAPHSVDGAIQRAMSLVPADRYATAGEFVAALEIATKEHVVVLPRHRRRPGARVTIAVAALGFAALAATAVTAPSKLGIGAAPADTTVFAVLPVEGDTLPELVAINDMLHQSFSAWRGVRIVDRMALRDARGTETPVRDDRSARQAAASVDAGRFVRARISRVGGGFRLWAGLYDVRTRNPLHQAAAVLPRDLGGADSALERLTAELFLREDPDGPLASRVVASAQLFSLGLRAVEAFRLEAADSLMLAALEADPQSARAAFWLAQVRGWKRDPPERWLTWVERAGSTLRLSADESVLARALMEVGERNFPRACRIYDSLRVRNERSFAAWYGSGMCQYDDNLVIRDQTSPSGWRFRTSSHAATRALARALELAPAMHRSFEARAYSSLRDLLFANDGILRSGASSGPDSIQFLAYPAWRGDSLIHVPFPADLFTRGRVTEPSRVLAVKHQRELLNRVAQSWATALPNSPGTKEALAIAIDLSGDAAAVDTIRAARTLATESQARFRLAVLEVLLRVSHGRRDTAQLRAAVVLAESLLARPRWDSEAAGLAAPVAALLGRCRLAAHLSARNVRPSHAAFLNVPVAAKAAADSITALAATGCRVAQDTSGIHATLEALRSDRIMPQAERDRTEYALFARAIMLTYPPDSARIVRLARVGPGSPLGVLAAAVRGDARAVRDLVAERALRRRGGPGSPDAMYSEAVALLQIGDSAAARDWIAPVFRRTSWLDLMLDGPVTTGALLRLGELAGAIGDDHESSEWRRLVSALRQE